MLHEVSEVASKVFFSYNGQWKHFGAITAQFLTRNESHLSSLTFLLQTSLSQQDHFVLKV